MAVAVAVNRSCSSDSNLAWERPYAAGLALKEKKKKKRESSIWEQHLARPAPQYRSWLRTLAL